MVWTASSSGVEPDPLSHANPLGHLPTRRAPPPRPGVCLRGAAPRAAGRQAPRAGGRVCVRRVEPQGPHGRGGGGARARGWEWDAAAPPWVRSVHDASPALQLRFLTRASCFISFYTPPPKKRVHNPLAPGPRGQDGGAEGGGRRRPRARPQQPRRRPAGLWPGRRVVLGAPLQPGVRRGAPRRRRRRQVRGRAALAPPRPARRRLRLAASPAARGGVCAAAFPGAPGRALSPTSPRSQPSALDHPEPSPPAAPFPPPNPTAPRGLSAIPLHATLNPHPSPPLNKTQPHLPTPPNPPAPRGLSAYEEEELMKAFEAERVLRRMTALPDQARRACNALRTCFAGAVGTLPAGARRAPRAFKRLRSCATLSPA